MRPRQALKEPKLVKATLGNALRLVQIFQPFLWQISVRMGVTRFRVQIMKAKIWPVKNDHETQSMLKARTLRTVCNLKRLKRELTKQVDHGFKIDRCC